jgi:hypothetical protein
MSSESEQSSKIVAAEAQRLIREGTNVLKEIGAHLVLVLENIQTAEEKHLKSALTNTSPSPDFSSQPESPKSPSASPNAHQTQRYPSNTPSDCAAQTQRYGYEQEEHQGEAAEESQKESQEESQQSIILTNNPTGFRKKT